MAETSITVKLLAAKCGQPDVDAIFRLPLSGLNIRNMNPLSQCPSLVDIDLSNNGIVRIEGLDACASNLRRLNLSANRIARMDGVEHCVALQELLLEGNCLSSITELQTLSALRELTRVHLQSLDRKLSNPVCSSNGYFEAVCKAAGSQLKILDGQRLAFVGSVYPEDGSSDGSTARGKNAALQLSDFKLEPGGGSGNGNWLEEVGGFKELTTSAGSDSEAQKTFAALVNECRTMESNATTLIKRSKQL